MLLAATKPPHTKYGHSKGDVAILMRQLMLIFVCAVPSKVCVFINGLMERTSHRDDRRCSETLRACGFHNWRFSIDMQKMVWSSLLNIKTAEISLFSTDFCLVCVSSVRKLYPFSARHVIVVNIRCVSDMTSCLLLYFNYILISQ